MNLDIAVEENPSAESFFARSAEPRHLRTDFGLKLSLHFEAAVLAGHMWHSFSFSSSEIPVHGEASEAPAETKSLGTCDIFCCSMDGRSLYDSTAWSDLCPVTDFMCLVHSCGQTEL